MVSIAVLAVGVGGGVWGHGLPAAGGFRLIGRGASIAFLAVGGGGGVATINTSRSLNTTAENNTVMTHVAEKRMEFMQDLPYASVAMTAARTNSPTDPT